MLKNQRKVPRPHLSGQLLPSTLAIEKILRDALRRGLAPDLQLCGNIAAMMGLHVSGVRVPASQGTRLQTPALIPWKQRYALVRTANARGLHVASPRDGLVVVSPEDQFRNVA